MERKKTRRLWSSGRRVAIVFSLFTVVALFGTMFFVAAEETLIENEEDTDNLATKFTGPDLDEDGTITSDEFDEWMNVMVTRREVRYREWFEIFDADGDGNVTEDERSAWIEEHRGNMTLWSGNGTVNGTERHRFRIRQKISRIRHARQRNMTRGENCTVEILDFCEPSRLNRNIRAVRSVLWQYDLR